MKRVGAFLAGIALLSVAYATPSFAQDVPWSLIKGSTFIGADVENSQGQDLGDIKDVVIDRASGRIEREVLRKRRRDGPRPRPPRPSGLPRRAAR